MQLISTNNQNDDIIGPKTWVDVYQNCGGELQSPVNLGIDNAAVYAHRMDALGRIRFSNGYQERVRGKLHNNGHTGQTKALTKNLPRSY